MSAVLPTPPAKKFTPDDLLRMPDEGKGYELVSGELKELNVSTLSTLWPAKSTACCVIM